MDLNCREMKWVNASLTSASGGLGVRFWYFWKFTGEDETLRVQGVVSVAFFSSSFLKGWFITDRTRALEL